MPAVSAGSIDLTSHAREWIARIWSPLQIDGARLLASYARRDLELLSSFLARARAIQARQAQTLRAWLEQPGTLARSPHLRGGLPPAALRRVEVFVEAGLDRPLPLADLAARAGLSVFHFARAFRVSTGLTPRAFVETRRIARARQLIAGTTQPLAAIAVDTGFGTQSRLTIAFKRATGFTPAAWRRSGRRMSAHAALRCAAVSFFSRSVSSVRYGVPSLRKTSWNQTSGSRSVYGLLPGIPRQVGLGLAHRPGPS